MCKITKQNEKKYDINKVFTTKQPMYRTSQHAHELCLQNRELQSIHLAYNIQMLVNLEIIRFIKHYYMCTNNQKKPWK